MDQYSREFIAEKARLRLDRFYRATRELGRAFKTEFILDYLSQPALRTRIRRGLLKGEQERGPGCEIPFYLTAHDSRSVLAVKGPLRFAPWTAPGPIREAAVYEEKGGNRYREVVPNPRPAVESISWNSSEASAIGKIKMKSKISIWDCRRAIEIAGGLPLAIRGDLFAEPGPHPVARWISETVLVTQLEVKQGRWVIGNIGFTRHGQEHLTKLARDIIADNERLYAQQQSDDPDS